MNTYYFGFFSWIICSIFATMSQAQTTSKYLYCGQLIDGINNNIQPEMTIIVEDNRIKAVEKGYRDAPEGTKVIEVLNDYGYILAKREELEVVLDFDLHVVGNLVGK
jgi:hypothetical protein